MVLLLIIVFACYLTFMTILVMGWNRGIRNEFKTKDLKSDLFISIIIPVRNEVHNILSLLLDLERQDHRNFEVIVVDDHSEDNTVQLVREVVVRNERFRILDNIGDGKKNALTLGIKAAKGSIIITTDADCKVLPEWVSTLALCFQHDEVKMVFGGVKIKAYSVFSSLQSLEFASLIGSGMAMAAWMHPVMCNGANLAFRKSVFDEAGGYEGNLHIASGDDEFLMRKVLALYPNGIRPLFYRQAVVTTLPNSSLKELFEQRIRWAGKWRASNSPLSKTIALFIFCIQLTTIAVPLLLVTGWIDLQISFILLLSKAGLELLFLRRVSRFLSLPWHWRAFIALQAIYPVYVVIIGLLSNFNSFEWKGRKLNSLTVGQKFNKEILG